MSEKKPEVIVLHESAGQGWLRDLSSVVCFVLLIGIGVLLDSSALQWVGALLGFLTIIARTMHIAKDSRMTTDEARKRLDEIDAGRGN